MKRMSRHEFGKRVAQQVFALTVATAVLLACKISQSIEIHEDGSGTMQVEVFLESFELDAMSEVRAGLQKALAEDPKMKLLSEGSRDGGHYFLLEKPFVAVSEINEDDSTFRWTSTRSADPESGAAERGFADLFERTYRLEMNLGQEDFQGVSPTEYRWKVTLPGKVVETNGRTVSSNTVEWDRLVLGGKRQFFVEARSLRLPGPGEVARWFTDRHKERYFDDEAVAWLQDGKVYVGNPARGERRELTQAGDSDLLEAGGSRLLHYRVDREWWGALPVDASILDLTKSSKRYDLQAVVGPHISPDGRFLSFGRLLNPPTESMEDLTEAVGSGLWLRDLDLGTEEKIAGDIPLPKFSRGSRAAQDYRGVEATSWMQERGTWSATGHRLYLERSLSNSNRSITYFTDLKERIWRPLECDGQFDAIVLSSSGEAVFVNRARDTHPYYDICRTDTKAAVARKLPGWAGIFQQGSILAGDYSWSGVLAVAIATSRDEEGWLKPPIRIVWGEAAEHSLDLPGEAELNYRFALRWHRTKPLLLYGNRVIDIDRRTVTLIAPGATTASWVVAPREAFPSLGATQGLITAIYWIIVALVLLCLIFGARGLVGRLMLRRAARPRPPACSKCGKAVEVGARFCRHCGTPVAD